MAARVNSQTWVAGPPLGAQARSCTLPFELWRARATPLAFATVERGSARFHCWRTAMDLAVCGECDFGRLIDEFESGSESERYFGGTCYVIEG